MAFSCTKLVDMPITNGPQFETHMVISVFQNNQWEVVDSIVIAAGDNDAFYNAYCEERNGVMVYVGEFSFENNTKKLKFEYYDHSVPYTFSDGLSLLNNQTAYSDFTSAYTGYLEMDSNAIYGQYMSGWQWYVDGIPNNNWIHTISEPGVYDIRLDAEFNGQTVSSLENKVYLGFENPSWGYFNVQELGGGEFEFTSYVQNNGATVEWEIDGNLVSTGTSSTAFLSQGVHKVKMKVTDPEGNTYSREQNVGYNATDYVESFNFVKPVGKDLYNTVIISYESNGVTYSSKHLNQSNSFISIGQENQILETVENLVVQYPVDLQFDMININNLQDPLLKINMSGKIGFLVEK